MFCPKCGSILLPREVDGKRALSCSCGYTESNSDKGRIKESVKQAKDIDVVHDKEDEMLPVTDAECPKCRNKKCWYWLIQTRSSDEPETKFLKCTKCKHIFRDYS